MAPVYRKPSRLKVSKTTAPAYTPGRFERSVLHCGLWYGECGGGGLKTGKKKMDAMMGDEEDEQEPGGEKRVDEHGHPSKEGRAQDGGHCTTVVGGADVQEKKGKEIVVIGDRGGKGKDMAENSGQQEQGKQQLLRVHVSQRQHPPLEQKQQKQLPMEFQSVDDYISTFDPLVIEEARESVRSSWQEHCAAEESVKGVVLGVEERGAEVRGGGLEIQAGNAKRPVSYHVKIGVRQGSLAELMMLCPPHVVVVLSSKKPPGSGKNVMEWIDQETGEDRPMVVAGIRLRSRRHEDSSYIIIKTYPVCELHWDAYAQGDSVDVRPCVAALKALMGSVHKEWWVTPAQTLVSPEREFDALHGIRTIDSELMKYILKPRLLAPLDTVYVQDANFRRNLWPQQVRHPPFVEFLKSEYNYKQLEAIEMTACQLTSESKNSQLDISDIRETRAPRRIPPKLPFVLIQGPPGTGKTHTVLGVLNVWHLVAYQQYYSSLIQAVVRKASCEGSGLNSTSHALDQRARRPRILVCAPSNAACDELMTRIMEKGFCDGNGNMYRPNLVRIGGDSVADARVRSRLLPTLVGNYSNMSQMQWQAAYQQASQSFQMIEKEARVEEMSLSKTTSKAELQKIAQSVVEKAQALDRIGRQLKKLEACKGHIFGQADSQNRKSNVELETLILEDAEMAFATLSSTQRKMFKDACNKTPFHTVLIDEAGQASEVAALQPLAAGAKNVVLVGDPQQLPATILSEAGKAAAMERSLFERLQIQGCPVILLSVQYRMHPEIRKFPSHHFYQDKLEDAPEVASMSPEIFHTRPYMGPYMVFDVTEGKEKRRKAGGSLSNESEAELAACLYHNLQIVLAKENVAKAVSVAVITPYREQRSLLMDTFKKICGEESLKQVSIETVDSYQGRQVDVVILSCVRAGSSGGLGFVNDVRRMNVAITRARRSLWILGALSTLRLNHEWESLIRDAEERGVVVQSANARDIFPDSAFWKTVGQREQAVLSKNKSGQDSKSKAEKVSCHIEKRIKSHPEQQIVNAESIAPLRGTQVKKGKRRRERSMSPEDVDLPKGKAQFPSLPTGR